MAPEAIPQATGSGSKLKKVPKWAWAGGIGLLGGVVYYVVKRKRAASTATATASNCTCDDGSSPTNGTCTDGSTPDCSGGGTSSTGYLVGGDNDAVGDASIVQAIDDLAASDTPGTSGTAPTAPTATTSAGSGRLVEGKKYGSGYYTRGKATPAGYTYLTPTTLKGYKGPIFYEKTLGKETRMGKTKLLPGTPEYAPTKDLTKKATRKTKVGANATP
jgi:hypothetical protein